MYARKELEKKELLLAKTEIEDLSERFGLKFDEVTEVPLLKTCFSQKKNIVKFEGNASKTLSEPSQQSSFNEPSRENPNSSSETLPQNRICTDYVFYEKSRLRCEKHRDYVCVTSLAVPCQDYAETEP